MLGFAVVVLILAALSYCAYFGLFLGLPLSDDPNSWAQLGSFMGGVLGPFFSLISIALLIKSLTLQNKANVNIFNELERNKKGDVVRRFESKFFNLIDSQKVTFANFSLDFTPKGKEVETLKSSKAISVLEDVLSSFDGLDNAEEYKKKLIKKLDDDDDIFSLVRVFYVIVKLICDAFPDKNEEHSKLRKEYIVTLINFTDYSMVKLMLITMKYENYASSRYLNANEDFKGVMKDLKLQEYYSSI